MLMTCGPWKPVYIESYTERISDVNFATQLNGSTATIIVTAEVHSTPAVNEERNVVFTLTAPSKDGIKTASATVTGASATANFTIDDPQLWYPHGYGKQPLYTLTATLGGCRVEKQIGIRDAKLIRRELDNEPGTSFFFQINGTPVFAAGVNWIPADSFLTRVDDKTTRQWLQMVKDAGFVMVR